MTAAELLRHYERVADSQDAVPRLRRFILELAVRGKLVPQDRKDEPAHKLLHRIGGERSRQLAAGEFRASKARELELSQQPFTLPETWAWAALGTVFLYDAGAKIEPRMLDPGYWLLELEDLEKDTGRLLTRLRVSDRQSQSTKSEFRSRDVLYGKLRPYLNKVLVADEPGYSTTEIVALRAYLPLCSEYCAIALRRPDFVDYVTRLGQGTKMPRLRSEDAVIAPFPLPPLAEQHRIVAKVDDLMALCDRLAAARAEREAARDRLTAASLARLNSPDPETFADDARFALDALPALTARPDQIRQFRQTILNLAVRGQLVAQSPTNEPAARLLQRIVAKKVERKQATGDARIKPEPDPDPADLPMPLPTGWAAQSFENLFLFIDYRGNTPPKTTDGIPLITAKNVRMGHLNRDPREFISAATFKTWMTRGFPAIGDLFFTTEAPLANVCLNDITEPFALAQRVICLQPYGEINTRFVMMALMSDLMQKLIDGQATGLTAKGIKAAKLKPLPIPIPPLAEQQRIVARVNELMSLCDQLEFSLNTAIEHRSRLLEALLHDALESGDQADTSAPADEVATA